MPGRKDYAVLDTYFSANPKHPKLIYLPSAQHQIIKQPKNTLHHKLDMHENSLESPLGNLIIIIKQVSLLLIRSVF